MGEGPRAEARGEPEAIAVEPVDRGVEVGHAEQRGDRPENLLLRQRGVGRHDEERVRRVEGVRSIDGAAAGRGTDRKSTRLNSSHTCATLMPSSAGKKKRNKH